MRLNSRTSTTNKYVIDAHALIWFVTGSPRLGSNAHAVLSDPNSVLYLPIIALAEACWAVERGKTTIPSVAALLSVVDAAPRVNRMFCTQPASLLEQFTYSDHWKPTSSAEVSAYVLGSEIVTPIEGLVTPCRRISSNAGR